jgi:hypothetical protein
VNALEPAQEVADMRPQAFDGIAVHFAQAVTTTGFYPSGQLTVSLPCSTTVEFKFIKKSSGGGTTWEGGSNPSYGTPACGSAPTPGSVTVNWQN